MPELLGSPAMRIIPAGSWNWQTARERSGNDYLPVGASGKMQEVMGYRQAVKAQDFDSCIPGSSPGSLVGDFGVSPKWIFFHCLASHFPTSGKLIKEPSQGSVGF